MILLDTNVLSEMFKPAPSRHVEVWLNQQRASDLYLSSVVLAEIEAGLALMPDGRRKTKIIQDFNDTVSVFGDRVLMFDDVCAEEYGEIFATRIRMGRPIEKFDCMIASTAVVHECLLATRNVRDFEGISGLKVINPWE